MSYQPSAISPQLLAGSHGGDLGEAASAQGRRPIEELCSHMLYLHELVLSCEIARCTLSSAAGIPPSSETSRLLTASFLSGLVKRLMSVLGWRPGAKRSIPARGWSASGVGVIGAGARQCARNASSERSLVWLGAGSVRKARRAPGGATRSGSSQPS